MLELFPYYYGKQDIFADGEFLNVIMMVSVGISMPLVSGRVKIKHVVIFTAAIKFSI